MRWAAALLVFSLPVMAEELTTSNVLPALSGFTTSGSTNATGGTGHASAGGGTYTSSFDVPLTEAEVQRGFTLNSALTVSSHSSNSVLATCSSITQASDCRDIFRLTLSLMDLTSTVVEKFEHEIELDYSGLENYSFTDKVGLNSYATLTGEFELYGIDAGYHSGMYGPVFSDPTLKFIYESAVEQQLLDQIAQLAVQIAFAPPPPPVIEVTSAPPAAEQPSTMMTSVDQTAPPPPPTVETIGPAPVEQQQQQQQEETEVEAAVEAEIEATEPEREPEPTEPGAETEVETEPEAETEVASEAVPPRRTRKEKVKAAAEKVAKKIAPSQRYTAASQTTVMVVMNMLAGKIVTDLTVPDTPGFFPVRGMDDTRSMSDPLIDYTLFGKSNAAHEALIQSEWSR
tara:strand:- start:696 stop:1895 length:1200 start_codon:yes stop_codon:yes gene_type:complete